MLEDLGNLGDFLGGLAVIITLAYLTLQVRQNTASVEASAVQSASQAFADSVESFARDPDTMRVYLAGVQDFDSLGPEDRQRFAAIMGGLLHRLEGFLVLIDRGILPPSYWDGAVNRIRGAFALPGTRAWWERGRHVFNQRVQTWIDEEVIGKQAR